VKRQLAATQRNIQGKVSRFEVRSIPPVPRPCEYLPTKIPFSPAHRGITSRAVLLHFVRAEIREKIVKKMQR